MGYTVEIKADDLIARCNATEIHGTPTWLAESAIMCVLVMQDQIERACYAFDRFELQILIRMHPFTPKRWFMMDKYKARSLCEYAGK